MMRVLVMIAVTGFLVSMVTLSVAVGIAGPEAIARGAWSWGDGHWGHFGIDTDDEDATPTGPQASREIAWTGGPSLQVDVPAHIDYAQAPGPGKLTVTGPKAAVEALVLEDGRLRYKDGGDTSEWRRHGHHWGRDFGRGPLTIVMTAPGVNRFDMGGSGRLAITGYHQDALTLDLSGHSDVSVKGEAKTLALDITGSADTDLAGLAVKDAIVTIEGSGQATIAPTDSAKLDISGSGDVTLTTHPARLESNISGSGAVHQAEGASPPPAPAPAVKPARI
jgi:hypothetical protein